MNLYTILMSYKMLHLNSHELSETSRDYLLSVLLEPEEILDIVTKRFNIHLKDLTYFAPCESNTVRVRSTLDLLSKDVRLIFELNKSMVDLLSSDYNVRPFSDDYLNFVQKSLDNVLKVFKNGDVKK